MSNHRNRLKTTISAVASAGLGNFTVSAASSGFRTFVSGDNALTFDCLITEGATWEVRTGCTYTHSGATLSRGTLEDSSTGSAIAFTTAAIVSQIPTAAWGNEVNDVSHDGGYVYARNDGTNTQSLTLSAFNRVRGNSDSPSNGALRTEVTDQRGWWDAAIARFQPTIAGYYLIVFGCQLSFTAATSGTATGISTLYLNGAVHVWGSRVEDSGATAINAGGIASSIIYLNGSTDYVEPYIFVGHSGLSSTVEIRALAHGTYFQARFLGR
jgi:hypothetical protein